MLKKLKLLAIPFLGIASLLLIFSSFDFKLGKIFFASAATESVSVIRQDCTGYSSCYASLSAWEAAQQKNLVTSNEIAVAIIEGTWTNPDTTAVTIDGWTTGPDNYIKIYTTTEARHGGVWNDTKYRLEPTDTDALRIQDDHVKVDGLQIGIINPTTTRKEFNSVFNQTGEITLSNSIIRGSGANSIGVSVGNISTGSLNLYNNIIYNAKNAYFGGVRYGGSGTLKAYNNTIMDCYYGIRRTSGAAIAKNNIVINAISSDYMSDSSVAWGAGSDYNISSDNTSTGGANDKINQTVTFADSAGNNYHLASSDAAAKDAGTDLSADTSLSFTTDIDGETRSGSWDIGADEYGAAGNGATPPPPQSDTTAPVRSGGSPTGALAAGTTQTTLTLATNENATCKYGTIANTAFASITNTFSTTGSTSHSASISTQNGQSYSYYVRCSDGSGNANSDDYLISFSVANPPAAEPIASSTPVTATTTQTTTATTSSGAPIVLYTDITSGPNTGGENNNGTYLSIFGKNFGNNIADVKVYVGNGEVARYMYLGASLGRPDVQQLSVQLGPNTVTGAIKVVVNGVDSNIDKTFTVRPGNFYFVSLTGSDSTGIVNDINRPYRTANYVMALPAFTVNDFMIIRGGNYDLSSGQENLYSNRWLNLGVGQGGSVKSGTSDTNRITIYGYPGENTIIDWGNNTAGNVFGIRTVSPTSYYTMANLNFDLKNSGGGAIFLGFYSTPTAYCNHCNVINIKVSGGMAGALSGVSSAYFHRVDDLKLYGFSIGNQSSLADPALASHVIYLSHFYNNADIGWIYVHDNAYGRAALQVAGDAWGSVRPSSWGTNSNVRIHDSLFKNLPQEAILFNLGSKEVYAYNNIIDNAVTKNNAFTAVAFRGAELDAGDYYFYNNTIHTDALGGQNYNGIIQLGYSPQSTYPRSVNLLNNIVYSKSINSNFYSINHALFTTNKVISNNNIWYNSNQIIPFLGANDKIINPQFMDPATSDFRLQSTSPAINTGSSLVSSVVVNDHNGISRPQGSGYDIGAHEYYEVATITVPTSTTTTSTTSTTTNPITTTADSTTNNTNSGSTSPGSTGSTGTLLRDADTQRTYYIDTNETKRLITSPTAFAQNGFNWKNVINVSDSELNRYVNGTPITGKIATTTSVAKNTPTVNPGQAISQKIVTIPAAMKKAALVKVKNTIYAIVNNQRYAIVSPSVFNAYKFSWGKVKTIAASQLNRYPRVKLVKAVESSAVYYITDRGQKKVIPSAGIFLAYGNKWSDIVEILPEDLAKYPDVKLVRLEGDTKIYLLENNTKRHIRSMDVFTRMKLRMDDVVNVKRIEFDVYQTGEDVK